MKRIISRLGLIIAGGISLFSLAGCAPGNTEETRASGDRKVLTLAAFTASKEAYRNAVIPAFQRYWKEKTGQEVEFRQAYEASGTLARNVIGGMEADVVALSLEDDVKKIEKAGLITHDWRSVGPNDGIASQSVVVIATRKGNPKGIHDWGDLTRHDVEILSPNPGTSGGAKWNVSAIYGAAHGMPGNGSDLLSGIRKNIIVMDKSGRESFSSFEHGLGDAAITYENEVLRAMEEGREYDIVYPSATVLIENPVAVVDQNAEKHGVKEVAEAFVEFLYSEEAQRAFAKHHLRPVLLEVQAEFADKYPQPKRLFTIREIGGWKRLDEVLFGPEGAWARANPYD